MSHRMLQISVSFYTESYMAFTVAPTVFVSVFDLLVLHFTLCYE